MWYNEKENILQSNPPYRGWLSEEEITIQYQDWKQVDNSFKAKEPPNRNYVWDSNTKDYVLDKAKALTTLNEEYLNRLLPIERAIAVVSADTTRTQEQKDNVLATLSSQMITIRQELIQKQGVIMNG